MKLPCLLRSLALVLASFSIAACSSSGGVDPAQNSPGAGGSGGAGGAGGAAGAGGSAGSMALGCGVCLGKSYTPCNEDGSPGPQELCGGVCVPGQGCLDCQPGTNACSGNEVRVCPESGVAAEGALVEACDVGAGLVCVDGACGKGCDMAAGLPSNVGCEFWAVDLDQQDGAGNDPASMPWGIVVSNAGQNTANVTVEYNEAPQGQPPQPKVLGQVSIQPGKLKSLTLPTREVDCGVKPNDYASPGTCLSSQAYRVTSSSPVVVYQFNVFENAFSNDASLLLPTNALGKSYRIVGWGAGHPIPIELGPIKFGVDRSYLTVVGVQPDTKVRVKPSFRLHANPTSTPPIPTLPAGEFVEFTIGPFDVLNLETDNALPEELLQMKGQVADLTGSSVEANKPVAVFSGVESTGAPGTLDVPKPPGWEGGAQGSGDNCCLDHLEEQMFPLESVGKKYVIPHSPIRSSGGYVEPDVLRFVGAAEPATVTTNLPAPFDQFTVQPGEIKDTWAQKGIVVNSSAPVIIGQITVSQGHTTDVIGDPDLTVFAPIEQYRTEYVIPVPPSWDRNYVVIAAQTGAEIMLDGQSTSSCTVAAAGDIDGVSYESRTCQVAEGSHVLTGNQPFGITVYGYGSAGSYAYAGGADVKPIYEVPVLN